MVHDGVTSGVQLGLHFRDVITAHGFDSRAAEMLETRRGLDEQRRAGVAHATVVVPLLLWSMKLVPSMWVALDVERYRPTSQSRS